MMQRHTRLRIVMPGLDPGIHVSLLLFKTWMAGSSPAMTRIGWW
jgi:hypothetical protein